MLTRIIGNISGRIEAIVVGLVTFVLLAIGFGSVGIVEGLDCDYGGNAVVNEGNYNVITPNSSGHSCLVAAVAIWSGLVTAPAGGVLTGLFVYRGIRRSTSKSNMRHE